MTAGAGRLSDAFARARAEGRAALVGYLPAGYPSEQGAIDALRAMVEGGCDVIEIGLPYSDPVMDGLTIQKATQAALSAGFRVRDVFTAVEAVRNRVDAPVLVMTYWNPVLQFGTDRFADSLRDAGGAGLITPDITPDSAAEWIATSERTGLDRVFLAAPSSTDARLRETATASRGFVYAASTMGVTGARANLDAAAKKLVARLRDVGASDVCVGIGISTADQVSEVVSYADGAIVGAALVTALADHGVAGVARAAGELARGVRLS